jgi:hypothetical protein
MPALLALATLVSVKEIEIILFAEVPFPVGLNKVVSLKENKNKNIFYVSFNLVAFIGLPLGRMSGCCLVKRRITLKLAQVKAHKNSANTTAPNCSTSPELHQNSNPDPT